MMQPGGVVVRTLGSQPRTSGLSPGSGGDNVVFLNAITSVHLLENRYGMQAEEL